MPYLPQDTMALTLTGSKRWPKLKVMERFAKQHCDLSAAKIDTAHETVELAINEVKPELEKLARQFSGFSWVAEKMSALL